MRLLLVLVLLCTAILVSVAENVSAGTYVSSRQYASLSPDELIDTVTELQDHVTHLDESSEDLSQLETSSHPTASKKHMKKRASAKKIQKKSTAKARAKAGASVAARALTSAKVARVQRIKQEIESRDMHRYKRGHTTEISFDEEAPAKSHSLLQAEEMVASLEKSLGFNPDSLPAPSFAFAEVGSKQKMKNKNTARASNTASHSAYFAPPEVPQALTPYSFPSPAEMAAFMPPQPVQASAQAQAAPEQQSQQSETELAMNLMFNLLQEKQTQKNTHNIMLQMQNMIAQRKASSVQQQQLQQRRAMGMFGAAAPTFGPTPATIADATLGQYPVPPMMQQQPNPMALGMNMPGQIIPPPTVPQQNPFADLHP